MGFSTDLVSGALRRSRFKKQPAVLLRQVASSEVSSVSGSDTCRERAHLNALEHLTVESVVLNQTPRWE